MQCLSPSEVMLARQARFSTKGSQREAQALIYLPNPSIAKAWGYSGGSITPATQAIGADALNSGYNVIKFQSLRGSGVNYGVLNDFNTLLKPQMIVPTP
jgi:hypothetical protein